MLTYDLTKHTFSAFPKLGFYYPVDIYWDICSKMDAEYSSSKKTKKPNGAWRNNNSLCFKTHFTKQKLS